MGERNHQSTVLYGDKSDAPAKTLGKHLEKSPVAAMLGKGPKRVKRNERIDQCPGVFHGVIIASCLLAWALTGCGYKTDPVYMAPAAEKNSTTVTDGTR